MHEHSDHISLEYIPYIFESGHESMLLTPGALIVVFCNHDHLQRQREMGWAHGLALLPRNYFQPLGRQGSQTSNDTEKLQRGYYQGKPLRKLVVKTQHAFYPNAINTLHVLYLIAKKNLPLLLLLLLLSYSIFLFFFIVAVHVFKGHPGCGSPSHVPSPRACTFVKPKKYSGVNSWARRIYA